MGFTLLSAITVVSQSLEEKAQDDIESIGSIRALPMVSEPNTSSKDDVSNKEKEGAPNKEDPSAKSDAILSVSLINKPSQQQNEDKPLESTEPDGKTISSSQTDSALSTIKTKTSDQSTETNSLSSKSISPLVKTIMESIDLSQTDSNFSSGDMTSTIYDRQTSSTRRLRPEEKTVTEPSGLSNMTKAVIAVTTILGALVLALVGYILYKKKIQKKKNEYYGSSLSKAPGQKDANATFLRELDEV
ncbi:hypothetical protein AX774_g2097 [Zancudomyces culisetae]|uniref:Uncharacterized protein n=1 Tax=Zancudomyces culisetae TaxID=1213189 RepID=A0A1R1PTV6_ZANCU|nr:hypothetical protein AX774_g2097 [Zancudomyces culisetae]|eukprot:OMH84381.1 hypothetical protein AX774_g2097 [Zancudomyces culisetae]